ncbi:N-acetyltransferase [Tenggerimyces flavus]|uniref:N-acetyltransferase n=1 Tax=Tenggerimyces flavus TaxID=1708749 RepID=A0ABV7Y270_9ACTN|nr:N-acetyltransferase [Tenggerimyces flavus]MBM7790801.1 GNAT superfamily N-acetyltransferase [Tenggerimyces flavus]
MITVSTVAERPEYAGRLGEVERTMPAYLSQGMLGGALYGRIVRTFPEYCVVATDPAGQVVGRGRSVPFALAERGGELPDGGWDAVLLWAFQDHGQRPAEAVSAIEIAVSPALSGQGLSGRILSAMREAAAGQGHRELFAPVRPTAKHEQPSLSMAEYVQLVRPDGLPVDPWLRVHARAGASIVKVAPRSMTISGSLAEWRDWTGLPFDTPGDVIVPQGLVPVHCDPRHDYAVYVEPNVWMRHPL